MNSKIKAYFKRTVKSMLVTPYLLYLLYLDFKGRGKKESQFWWALTVFFVKPCRLGLAFSLDNSIVYEKANAQTNKKDKLM